MHPCAEDQSSANLWSHFISAVADKSSWRQKPFYFTSPRRSKILTRETKKKKKKMATSLSKILTRSKAHRHMFSATTTISTSHSIQRQFSAVADSSFSTSAALGSQTSPPAPPQGMVSQPLCRDIKNRFWMFESFQTRNEGRSGHNCCCSCLERLPSVSVHGKSSEEKKRSVSLLLLQLFQSVKEFTFTCCLVLGIHVVLWWGK